MVINISLSKQEIEEILMNHLRQTIPTLVGGRIGEIVNQTNGMLEKVTFTVTVKEGPPKK